jgi:chromosome partitioning protein
MKTNKAKKKAGGAKVLAIVARKGGVGKSDFARSIAVQGLMAGIKTAIIDADPQATSYKWSRRRKEAAPAVIQLGTQTLGDVVAELKSRGATLIVIDTPPHDQPLINIAAGEADASLIITQPYPDDLQEVGVPATILQALGKPAGIILNNVPARSHALTMARAALATFSMPTCPTAISHLMSHPYASAEGQTVQEREPNGKAATEVSEVWSWLESVGIV